MSGGMFACIDRLWSPGDEVVITFAMPVEVQRWEKNQNAVSVKRGPLSFSLSIGERWEKYGTNAAWPEWEVFPTTRMELRTGAGLGGCDAFVHRRVPDARPACRPMDTGIACHS